MSVAVVFLAVIGAMVAWWLSHQRLMSKPWLEVGAPDDLPVARASSLPAATIGLGVFLAVVGSLFALLISAYLMRMHAADWSPPPAPKLLLLNTGVLIFSSVALQAAQVAAYRGQIDNVRAALVAAGISAFAFLVGQLLAWQQLSAAGYFVATNPANAFFYLLTGLHGLHLLGGLMVLALTANKAWQSFDVAQVHLRLKLCAIYWHYLLVLWLVLFTLLTPWVDDFAVICRGLLT